MTNSPSANLHPARTVRAIAAGIVPEIPDSGRTGGPGRTGAVLHMPSLARHQSPTEVTQ